MLIFVFRQTFCVGAAIVTRLYGDNVSGGERGSRVSDVGKGVAELVMGKGIAEVLTGEKG